MEVKFRDLSAWLKLAVIGGWTAAVLFGLSALVGMIEGLFYY